MVQLDRGDRRTLGRILAQEREYKVLQAFLNGPAGSRMPQGTRDLATAFWIALTGPQQDAEKWAAKVRGAEGVSSEQELLLEEAIGAQPPSAIAASTQQRIEPLAYGMRMALLDRYAADKARQGQYRLAAESYSAVLRMEIAATWRANPEATQRWAKALNLAQAYHRFDPKGDWPSFEYEVRAGQNLILIRKDILQQRPLMKLCVGMLRLHNNIHGYIHEKQKLRVPTDMPKVIVDLDERIVLYMQGDEVVQAWNVGVGKAGQETPPGRYQVGIKLENPPHMPMGGPSLHFGHKDNPLGSRWIAWHQGGERTSFGFHGTNDEASVGQAVSKGCVRMLKADVERLFELLPKGAEIIVQH